MTFVRKPWYDQDPTTPASAGQLNDLEERIHVLDETSLNSTDLEEFVIGSDLKNATTGEVPIRQSDGSWAPGPAGVLARYVHNQTPASFNWVINHNLGAPPVAILIYDSEGYEYWGVQRTDTSPNSLTLTFNTAVAGTATLQ